MKQAQAKLFDGMKSTRLEDLPDEAWRIITGDGKSNDKTSQLYGAVAWLYRCVDIRAAAVSSMPFDIVRGETVVMSSDEGAPEQMRWLGDLPYLLYRTDAALALSGQAYWFHERNLLRTLDARWLKPGTVKPVIDAERGLTGFTRRIDGHDRPLDIQDVVYFWLPDPYIEIGPPEHTPGQAALAAAGVLNAMTEFVTGYFERGMIKATLLKYTQPIAPTEAERVREWWRRVATGIKNAFSTEVIRGDFEPLIIGDGLSELQNTALTAEQRESVCTALGVPQSKVTANAANYATANADALAFIQDTIVPECRLIAAAINDQLLSATGLRLVFRPESLTIMQEDEERRAGSLKMLVDAGMSLEMALEILGYDLPEGIELREPAAATPPQLLPFTGQTALPVNEQANEAERAEETRRFTRWIKARPDADVGRFASAILSYEEKVAIAEGVRDVDAPFRESYP